MSASKALFHVAGSFGGPRRVAEMPLQHNKGHNDRPQHFAHQQKSLADDSDKAFICVCYGMEITKQKNDTDCDREQSTV